MKSVYINNRMREIESAFNSSLTVSRNLQDPKISAMLAEYLTVLTCGIYEDCIEFLFGERAAASKDEQLRAFVTSAMNDRFKNPKYEKLKSLLEWFDVKYRKDFRSSIKDRTIESLDSIVDNKNSIAHGKPANITLQDFQKFHKEAIKIFPALEKVFHL
jgi:hypothetical protein